MATLIRVDKNGSKYYEGMVKCDRCNGRGWYAIGVHNGQLVPARPDSAICYKCLGEGKVMGKWIERTPEYQAKLDAKREARAKAKLAEWEAKQAEYEKVRLLKEQEKLAKEARIKAQKAISQYVGEVGQKLEVNVIYQFTGTWKQKSYIGFGMETMHCHNFKDADGNVLIWKTGTPLDLDNGTAVILKGTVKDHSVYKDEKQTVMSRCKISKIDSADAGEGPHQEYSGDVEEALQDFMDYVNGEGE